MLALVALRLVIVININMRCIEMHWSYSVPAYAVLININMRCIEIMTRLQAELLWL